MKEKRKSLYSDEVSNCTIYMYL